MPRSGGPGAAIIYYLIIGVIGAGITLFWTTVLDYSSLSETLLGREQVQSSALSGIIEFLLSPLLLLATLYLVAGISHLILVMFDGAQSGFNTSVRVIAYAYSPVLFGVVPVLGSIVALVWTIVLAIVGLREAHLTSRGKAAAAVLLPAGCLFVLLTLVAMMAMALGLLGGKL